MDPKANIERQRELVGDITHIQDSGADSSPYAIEDLAFELAESVQSLDEWRSKGGFDPYDERDEDEIAEDAIDLVWLRYGSKMRDLLKQIAEACEESGVYCGEPFDMSGDDYQWSMMAWRTRSDRAAKLHERGIDITVQIAESREYDGEKPTGINFGLDIVEWGGRMLGGLTPFNYTEDCWVDARDREAVSDRWKILSDADVSEIPHLIKENER